MPTRSSGAFCHLDERRDEQAVITAFGCLGDDWVVSLGYGKIIHSSETAIQILTDRAPTAGAQVEIGVRYRDREDMCRFWGVVSGVTLSADWRRYLLDIRVIPDIADHEYQRDLH